jgi:hypothetical protein
MADKPALSILNLIHKTEFMIPRAVDVVVGTQP